MSTWLEDSLEKELTKSKAVVSRLNAEKEKYSGDLDSIDQWLLLFDAASSLNHLAIHIQSLRDQVDIANQRNEFLRRR